MRSTIIAVLMCMGIITLAQEPLADKPSHEHHVWSYTGEYGPTHWAELDPEYSSCGGKFQSPINIVTSKSIDQDLPPLEFHYHPFFVDLVNNGHTLIEKIVEPKALTFNGEYYSLLQFHFHTPSEHTVNGEHYAMEIHFVHKSLDGDYAVIAVLIEEGNQYNPFIAHFMKSLPSHLNEEIKAEEMADPTEVFPTDFSKFYHYSGSLTTPPCTEGINWIVLENPVQATKAQIEAIHNIIHDDNRPIQSLNERPIYHAGNY